MESWETICRKFEENIKWGSSQIAAQNALSSITKVKEELGRLYKSISNELAVKIFKQIEDLENSIIFAAKSER